MAAILGGGLVEIECASGQIKCFLVRNNCAKFQNFCTNRPQIAFFRLYRLDYMYKSGKSWNIDYRAARFEPGTFTFHENLKLFPALWQARIYGEGNEGN